MFPLASLWLLVEPLLEQIAVDEVCSLLAKMGIMSKTEASVITTAEEVRLAVGKLKFYSQPSDYPDPPPGQTNDSNIEVTQP